MLENLLIQRLKENPEKTAIVYENLKISYQELYAQIRGFSYKLSSLGISEGDCIAIVLPNCPEFVVSFYAVAKLKAIALPLNHLFKGEEISYYISDSNAKVIITDKKRADLAHQIISKINQNIELIVVDGISPFSPTEKTKFLDSSFSFAGNVIYQYSSGSTGRPKRVFRTQYNLYHEAKNFAETAKFNSGDSILCIVPLYHAHGLGNCLLAALCNGATLVILEPVVQQGTPVEIPFVFRRQRVLELIEKETVTILPAVPYLFNTLAETPTDIQVDLSSLRLCFSAGNFLSKEIFDKFLHRWHVPVRQLYGCTEAGSVSINLDDQPEITYDSVGNPMNNVEIKIIDEDGKVVPDGNIGEVVITSEALTSGYDNMPELNQQAFQNGAFFTGDLGKKDELGRVYITGRKKILIDTGGYKVDPIEIEDVLISHPLVMEAVVVGVKGTDAGEKIKAVIVPNGECDASEIRLFCKEKLAEYKTPKIIEFRDEIPKSTLGKILRK
ncbi:MAG: acyl--CoA ligase [Moorea sp. SIO3G5]|nr:acyl--CoA ligase [Moorena sp. SIO3G5]